MTPNHIPEKAEVILCEQEEEVKVKDKADLEEPASDPNLEI